MRSILAIFILASISQAASITQAYSFSNFGISSGPSSSNCTTFGPTSVMRSTGIGYGIAQASPGCGTLEDLKNNFGAGNLVTASTTAGGSDTGVFGAFSGTGSASAKAQANALGVDAQFSVIGLPGPNAVRGSEALAFFSESLTTTGSTVRYNLNLSGSQSFANTVPGQTGAGEGFLILMYRIGSQPFLNPVFRGYVAPANPYALIGSTYQYTSGNGVTIGTSSLSINRAFSFDFAFDPSQPNLSLYLYAGTYVNGNAEVKVLYGGTMDILSVEAFTSSGAPVSITRGSSLTDVPEPNFAIPFALLASIAPFTIRRSGQRRNNPARENSLG
ncbi:MAG: hypothetical protein FJW36_21385 [Acidobacteria bacterium]|nr:hypothetical protein [Acidobacteriota bacterium]